MHMYIYIYIYIHTSLCTYLYIWAGALSKLGRAAMHNMCRHRISGI